MTKDEAEIAKLVAEAEQAKAAVEKTRAEIEQLRISNAKLEAEIAKVQAEAAAQAVRTEAERLDLEQVRRKLEEELTANKYHHVYVLNESISPSSVKACIDQLNKWVRLSRDKPKREKPPIEIVFSSPGGSVIDGMALFDCIQQVRRAGHHVTTSTIGYAASMAGILLQAGDKRVMGREAYILVHEVSFGAGGKIGEVEDEVKFVKKIQDRVLSIFASRTKLSKRQLDSRWKRKDWWLDSDEALQLGFVDEVR